MQQMGLLWKSICFVAVGVQTKMCEANNNVAQETKPNYQQHQTSGFLSDYRYHFFWGSTEFSLVKQFLTDL